MLFKYKKYLMALGIVILCIIALIVINIVNKITFKNQLTTQIGTPISKVTTTSNNNNKGIENTIKQNSIAQQNNKNIDNIEKKNTTSSSENSSNNNTNNSNLETSTTMAYATKNIIKDDNCNINYNKELTIKSKNKELIYKIINARMLSSNEFSFGVKIIKNDGIGSLNVIALDNCGNSLIVTPSNQSAGDVIDYTATLENPNTKCLEISVQNEFDVSDQETTQVTVNFAKKETTDSLYITNSKDNTNTIKNDENNDKKNTSNNKNKVDK